MNPQLPSRKKLVPPRKRFEVIFSRALACFLRAIDPILFYLPSELADAIFGEAEAEPQIVVDGRRKSGRHGRREVMLSVSHITDCDSSVD